MHDELFHFLFNRKIRHHGTTIATLLICFSRGTGHRDFARRVPRRPVRTKILFSILGAAPFTLVLPYLNLFWTLVIAVIIGFIIASAFSAILVYATDLKPDKVGMISGIFFGLMFGLGGIGSAFFGWLADETSIEFIFKVSTLLPLLGIIAGFLPNIKPSNR